MSDSKKNRNARPNLESLEQRWVPAGGNWVLDATKVDMSRVLIHFKTTEPIHLEADAYGRGVDVERTFDLTPGIYETKISPSVDYAGTLDKLLTDPRISRIDQNFRMFTQAIPNDPRYNEQWGLNNSGQTGGTPGADISAQAGWDIGRGTGKTIVAVVDTGVDYNHPDLVANMWKNGGEIPGNGIDDDANGYVDDVNGYDTINGDPDPMDDVDHGTHCAGIIGAAGNNGLGVSGVAWKTQIMAVKALGTSGGNTLTVLQGMDYAVQNGAKIISLSLGGGGSPGDATDVFITNAATKGVLFVCAAGNGGSDGIGDNNDQVHNYPSDYTCENIIAVAASTDSDVLTGFSNYGNVSVDIAAPGENILSTLPVSMGSYGQMSGTSMATPMVSGALVVMFDTNPGLTYKEYITSLYNGADKLPSLAGKISTGARLNLEKSLPAPQTITFDALGSVPYGTAPLALAATGGGSGNPVTFTVISGPGTIIAGKLRIDGAGDIVIEANQAGNKAFHPANPVRQTLVVTKVNLTLDVADTQRNYGGAIPSYSYIATGFVNGDDLGDLVGLTTISSALTTSVPGTYSIVPDATSPNYNISFLPGVLTINPAPLIITAKSYSMTYGGVFPSKLEWTVSGLVLGETESVIAGLEVNTTAKPTSNAGTHFIFPLGSSTNYAITLVRGTLTIGQQPLTVTASDASRVFGDPNPVFSVSVSGLANGDTRANIAGLGATTTAGLRSPVGVYPIRPTGTNPNYSITYIAANLAVGQRDLIVAGGKVSSTYGSDPGTLPYTVTGLVSPDTSAIIDNLGATTPADALSDVGVYPIVMTGGTTDTNYRVILRDGAVTVGQAPLYFAAKNATKVYGDPLPAFSVDVTGWVNGDDPTQVSGVSVETTGSASSKVGTYALHPTGISTDPNYLPIYVDGQMTVTKAALTVVSENSSKTYGQGNPLFAPSSLVGLVNGDTVAQLGYWGKTTATVFSPAGTYDLVPTISNPNYEPTFQSGKFEILPAPLTIRAIDATRGYGQANPTFRVEVTGLVGKDTVANIKDLGATTIANKLTPIGTYDIVPSGTNPNYLINYVPANLQVAPAVLTISANAQSRVYGDPNPVLNPVVTGLVNGDKESDIQGLGAFTSATQASNVGVYAITPTGSNPNYIVNLVPSTLTVEPATLRIIADNKTVVRNVDSMPALTWHAEGFKNGDNQNLLTSQPQLSTTGTPGSPFGAYPILVQITHPSLPNYYPIVGVPGTYTVTPVTKTVVPIGYHPIIVPGSAGQVFLYGNDNKLIASLNPFPGYRGSVSTVTADLDADGVLDYITTIPGAGYSPIVKTYSGRTLGLISSFNAYSTNFTGGITVTVGDLDGDSRPEIITGTGQGSAPHVKAFTASGATVASFFAYDQNFTRGVNVSAGDVNGDGKLEIVTSPNSGGGPNVKVFSGTGKQQSSFFAYASNYTGGFSLTTGDINHDGKSEIITVGGPGASSVLRVFDGAGAKLNEWIPNNAFSGVTRVLTVDLNGDGAAEIVTALGTPGGPVVKAFTGSGQMTGQILAYPFGYNGGVNIQAVTSKSGTGWDVVTNPASSAVKPEVKRFATDRLAFVDSFFAGYYSVPQKV